MHVPVGRLSQDSTFDLLDFPSKITEPRVRCREGHRKQRYGRLTALRLCKLPEISEIGSYKTMLTQMKRDN